MQAIVVIMRKGASLKDIAGKAGVSVALVSYVLNNKKTDRINKATAQKIRDIAKQLHYSTNELAKSLKTNKTNTIGVIVSDISNPFSANLARIIENEAEQHQYTTIFGSSDEDLDKFEKLVHTLVNRKVDGLILSPPAGAEEILLQLQQRDIPFVLLDRYFSAVKTSYVIIDNYAASLEAVNHLIDGGRKRIGMITYDTGLLHLQDRKNGYVGALENSRQGFDKARLKLVGIDNNVLTIENALQDLLSGKQPVDAILFGSNKIALICLKYINRLPLKVPQQLAVVCFDYSEMLDLFYSPVTSIKQPLDAIGHEAVQCLMQNMNDTANTLAIQLKAELVVQQSTQPAVKRIEKK